MESKKYTRGTILYSPDMIVDRCFQIKTGIIEEIKEHQQIQKYLPGDYALLMEMFHQEICTSSFIVAQNSTITWISKNEVLSQNTAYFEYLCKKLKKEKAQNELLKIDDPIIKLSRYLYYQYEENKLLSFYLTITIEQLCYDIHLKHQDFLQSIAFLENTKVIKRGGKLMNIINLQKLKDYAFMTS